jgi:ABC-type transport system involved in multi-copper enzyme maturation permease subunit
LRVRNTPFAWLLAKEWRELLASRAWWVMLALIGPLVGVSFISAVRTYAELSGLNGTAAGVGEAFSPLVGVWAPTFSACELAAAFLLPFVAIRVVGGDRQSGALKLEAQQPMPPAWRIAAKALVLLGAWLVALMPAVLAAVLWRAYGGSVYPPELAALAFGHVLNAGLTIALAAAAASLTEHPSTAAIVTLSVTVGTWIVNFIAAIHGGLWQRIAEYTPTAMVAQFQHGLVRLDVALVSLLLTFAGLALAAVWMQIGAPVLRRASESAIVAAITAALLLGATFAWRSWDLSEARINSLPEPDEQALARIHAPLHMEIHFAPEDPRRTDLETKTLSKLRRALPKLQVTYVSSTSTGLFEQTAAHYGEIFYDLGGRRAENRLTSADGVLDTIYALAGIAPPSETDDSVFRGHPLAVPPRRAGTVFYGIWPALVVAAALFHRRRHA